MNHSSSSSRSTVTSTTVAHIVKTLRWFTAHRLETLEAAAAHADDLMAFLNHHIDDRCATKKGERVSIFHLTRTECIDWKRLSSAIPNPCRWIVDYNCLCRAIRCAVRIIDRRHTILHSVLRMIRIGLIQWMDTLEPVIEDGDDDSTTESHKEPSASRQHKSPYKVVPNTKKNRAPTPT